MGVEGTDEGGYWAPMNILLITDEGAVPHRPTACSSPMSEPFLTDQQQPIPVMAV